MEQINRYHIILDEEILSSHFTLQEAQLEVKSLEKGDLHDDNFDYLTYQIGIAQDFGAYSDGSFKCFLCGAIYDESECVEADDDTFCKGCWDDIQAEKDMPHESLTKEELNK